MVITNNVATQSSTGMCLLPEKMLRRTKARITLF